MLGAVVEVALDAPARGVAGLDEAFTRCAQLFARLRVGDRLRCELRERAEPRLRTRRQRRGAGARGSDDTPLASGDVDRCHGGGAGADFRLERLVGAQLGLVGAHRSPVAQDPACEGRGFEVEGAPDRYRGRSRGAPAGDDLPAVAVGPDQARHVGLQQGAGLGHDAVEHFLLRRPGGHEDRDAAERRLLLGERPVGALAIAKHALRAPALELRGRPRGEDPQRGQLLLVGPQRRRRKHAEMAQVLAIGSSQRDRQVAVEPQPGHHLVVGEALEYALGEGHQARGPNVRAGRTGEAVLGRRREPVPLPARKQPRPLGILRYERSDESHLRREGLRDSLDESLEEPFSDRAGRFLRDEPQQILAARSAGLRSVRGPCLAHCRRRYPWTRLRRKTIARDMGSVAPSSDRPGESCERRTTRAQTTANGYGRV